MGDLNIIQALLLRLDEEEIRLRETHVYRLKNAPALDVAAAVNDFLRSERQAEEPLPGALSPFQQIEREVVVVPEPVSNAIIISATPRFFKEILELVEEIDAQPAQVIIQVLIAEVMLHNTDEFGVELGLQDSLLFDRSLLGDLITTVNTVQESTPAGIITNTQETIQSATLTPGYNFNNFPLGNSGSDRSLRRSENVAGQALSDFSIGRINSELGFGGLVLAASSESVSILIRALQESRRLEVLGRPQIMTLDNQPAFIQVGQRVPRVVGVTISEVGQVNTVTLENVGLILGVTPRISPAGMVVMEIDAEKSELGPELEGIPISISATGEVIRSPRINTTLAQTTVSALSGETIVLGGLIAKSQSTIARRVPYLADIPLLGHLFRFDGEVKRRAELLIIMTPHVVRTSEDAERIRHIEECRMNWTFADVQKLHGTGGFCQRQDCPYCEARTPVVYPDLNPSGVVPEQVPPADEEVAPPEEVPQTTDLGLAAPPEVKQISFDEPWPID
jgi:type II secretory pathway component GspD/PulD (secretin)